MKFALYCTCGESMVGGISPDAKYPGVKAAWDSIHAGEGHAPCDQRTAANARRREERTPERVPTAATQ